MESTFKLLKIFRDQILTMGKFAPEKFTIFRSSYGTVIIFLFKMAVYSRVALYRHGYGISGKVFWSKEFLNN